MERTLTCIGCPLGCQISVAANDSGEMQISGYTCKRGREYAQKEVVRPERTVTSTVRVEGGAIPVVSVRTAADVPKDRIGAVMRCINALRVKAPVRMGDVLDENVAGTGVALIATKTVRNG